VTEYFSVANTIFAVQLFTLGLVLHLWFDMMGHFEAGGRIASLVMLGALVVYLAPAIGVAYRRIRGELGI